MITKVGGFLDRNMSIDYDIWRKNHTACVMTVQRFCDLDKRSDAKGRSIKCNSALCVMKNAMQDIQGYFRQNERSSAELCFLIRNIDVIVTGILDISNLLLGIGLNKQEKAIERCFTNKGIICSFRTLRSMVLAHPVDTHYINDKGELETVYLEDILPFNPSIDGLIIKNKCDYVKRMCRPETNESFFEPLIIDTDIVPTINTIVDSIELLTQEIKKQIAIAETDLTKEKMVLVKETIQDYIISLDKELEKRYPSAVETIKYDNGSVGRYSIVYECLMYYNANYSKSTMEKYQLFLRYVESELHRIENDLQNMEFDEDKYFTRFNNSNFAAPYFYEQQKMEYLRSSDESSYTENYIGNDTLSNELWGIRCFRILIPFIEEHIPVDVSVSDKELYCLYIAAKYLSNVSSSCD